MQKLNDIPLLVISPFLVLPSVVQGTFWDHSQMAGMQKDDLCLLKILVASALANTLMVQQSIFHLMKLQNGMHAPMSGIAEPKGLRVR